MFESGLRIIGVLTFLLGSYSIRSPGYSFADEVDPMISADVDFEHLGPALAALRQRAQMTAYEVAKRIGRSPSGVSRYENGQGVINSKVLLKYLNAVGANLSDLQDAIRQVGQAPKGAWS